MVVGSNKPKRKRRQRIGECYMEKKVVKKEVYELTEKDLFEWFECGWNSHDAFEIGFGSKELTEREAREARSALEYSFRQNLKEWEQNQK